MSRVKDDKLSWFPCYAKNILSDLRWRLAAPEVKGAYWELLLQEWVEGSLPIDDLSLAELSALRDRWPHHAPAVRQFFYERQGRLYNETLERIRQEQIRQHNRLSEAGKRGALSRDQNRRSQARHQASPKPGLSIQEREKKEDSQPPPDPLAPPLLRSVSTLEVVSNTRDHTVLREDKMHGEAQKPNGKGEVTRNSRDDEESMLAYQVETLNKSEDRIGLADHRMGATLRLIARHLPYAIIIQGLARMQDARLQRLAGDANAPSDLSRYYLGVIRGLCRDHGLTVPFGAPRGTPEEALENSHLS